MEPTVVVEDKLLRRPPWPVDSVVNAVFSPCGQYRYELREVWDPTGPLVLWLLMNPSTACPTHGDPTLRRTGTFARAWSYGGQLVGNVHAYRATDKRRLLEVEDPIGPKNDEIILAMAKEARTIILTDNPRRLCVQEERRLLIYYAIIRDFVISSWPRMVRQSIHCTCRRHCDLYLILL